MRILKVFCTKEERRNLGLEFTILERYDGFVLLQGSPVAARRLAARYVVEDITSQYAIRTGERVIKTTLPRINETGRTRPHPAYRRAETTRSLGYHRALCVAMALAPLAVEPPQARDFVSAFLGHWGKVLDRPSRRRPRRRRKVR